MKYELLEWRDGEEDAVVVDAVADAVAVQLQGTKASERSQVLAADLRRWQTHSVKIENSIKKY